jgi:hypothetical protein
LRTISFTSSPTQLSTYFFKIKEEGEGKRKKKCKKRKRKFFKDRGGWRSKKFFFYKKLCSTVFDWLKMEFRSIILLVAEKRWHLYLFFFFDKMCPLSIKKAFLSRQTDHTVVATEPSISDRPFACEGDLPIPKKSCTLILLLIEGNHIYLSPW